MSLEILNYEAPRTSSMSRCARVTAVISAIALTMLPLVFVINDCIVPWPVPLLGLDDTEKIALVATLGLIYIASRVLLSPRGWAIKCVALIALIPVVVFVAYAVNRFVWIDYFSAQREIAKRVGGAAAIGMFGLFILLRGTTREP